MEADAAAFEEGLEDRAANRAQVANQAQVIADAVMQQLQAGGFPQVPIHGVIPQTTISRELKVFAQFCGKWLFPHFGNASNHEEHCNNAEVHNIAKMFVEYGKDTIS